MATIWDVPERESSLLKFSSMTPLSPKTIALKKEDSFWEKLFIIFPLMVWRMLYSPR